MGIRYGISCRPFPQVAASQHVALYGSHCATSGNVASLDVAGQSHLDVNPSLTRAFSQETLACRSCLKGLAAHTQKPDVLKAVLFDWHCETLAKKVVVVHRRLLGLRHLSNRVNFSVDVQNVPTCLIRRF